MKTLQEIKEEVAKDIGHDSWEAFRLKYIISERTLERVAHLFAREALDTAAEMADFREITPKEEEEGDTNTICNDHGIGYCVNKEVILSIKSHLK